MAVMDADIVRSERISARVREHEAEAIRRRAREQRQTVAEFVRALLRQSIAEADEN